MENGRESLFLLGCVLCVCAGVDGWMERGGRPVVLQGVVVGGGATQVVVVLPVLRGRSSVYSSN